MSGGTRASTTGAVRVVLIAGNVIASLVLSQSLGWPGDDTLTIAVSRIQADEFPAIECFVSVVDENGEVVAGLVAENFQVWEDSEVVGNFVVRSVLPGEERIAVVLALDCSGSMRGEPIKSAKEAAADFARRLSDTDALGVMSFATSVERGSPLSTDRAAANRALDMMKTKGNTALYDALSTAVEEVSAATADRRAVVALTDGKDTASGSSAASCIDLAQRSGVEVYCVGLGREVDEDVLRHIATETGGDAFFAASPEDLVELYRRIARQVQTQYVLSYTAPSDEAGHVWRTLRISVSHAGAQATDQRQYLARQSPKGSVGSGGPELTSLGYIGIAVFVLLDCVLLAIWLRRRSAASSS